MTQMRVLSATAISAMPIGIFRRERIENYRESTTFVQ
jgi:hypothetical protein